MSSTPAITISYTLNPPQSTSTEGLEMSKTSSFPISSSSSQSEQKDLEEYYRSLRKALAEAKSKVGDELTVWRDRVGKEEVEKEPVARDEEDEDDDEEEA